MGVLDFFRRAEPMDEPEPVTRETTVPTVRRAIYQRQYAGATNGPLYQDFVASQLSADAEIVTALSTLRARARNLERNNGHARRFIQLMEDNIVGHAGFSMVSRAKTKTGALETRLNDNLKDVWTEFASEDITADGMMDMVEMAKAGVRSWCRDGEAFYQILSGPQYNGGVAFHMLEADMCDETLSKVDPKTNNEIRMGVELDNHEKPVAYWFLTRHPGDYTFSPRTWRDKYRRIPADRIIHVYAKRRPSQTRGEPPMAPIMNDTKMLAGYRESEIVHRRVAAAKMGFFVQGENSSPVTGVADEQDVDTGDLMINANPGEMKALPSGYDFKTFDANSTSTDYGVFEKQIIRSIAVGLGPSYFDLAMDLDDVSYSSIRQGALSDRDFYRGMQTFFIRRLMLPVFRAWYHRNAGGLNPDLEIPPSKYSKFLKSVKFSGRGWQWVDPQKEVKAARDAIDGRLTSRTRVVAEQGGDFAEVIDDLVDEQKLLDEANLPEPQKPQNTVVEKPENTE